MTQWIRTHVGIVLAVLGVLVVSACGAGEKSPSEALADALEQTFGDSVAFEASFVVDGEARDEIEAEDPEALRIIDNARLAGRVGDGTFAVSIGLTGAELLELAWPDDNTVYLRANLDALSEVAGEDLPDLQGMVADLQGSGLPPRLIEVATALVDGDWVGIVLPEDLEGDDLPTGGLPMPIDPEEAERLREEFERRYEDPEEFIDRFVEIDETESDVGRRFELTIRARDLGAELADIARTADSTALDPADIEAELDETPETLGGIAVTVDGDVVTRVEADLLEMARSGGEEDVPSGTALIAVDFADHGAIEAVTAPADATTIEVEELVQLIFGILLGGLGQG